MFFIHVSAIQFSLATQALLPLGGQHVFLSYGSCHPYFVQMFLYMQELEGNHGFAK